MIRQLMIGIIIIYALVTQHVLYLQHLENDRLKAINKTLLSTCTNVKIEPDEQIRYK